MCFWGHFSELLRDYESKEEEIIRQQQALQETTDKHLVCGWGTEVRDP